MTTWTNGIPDNTGFDRYGDAPTDYAGASADGRLRVLVEHDWAGDYEFSMCCVWQNTETGELRAAVDSGCSCPTPFGDLTWDGMAPISEPDDLKPLLYGDHGTLYDVPGWDSHDPGIADLKLKVHAALREARSAALDQAEAATPETESEGRNDG